MKQKLTITINVPAGYKDYWDGYDVLLVDDEMTELPKSWDEFCKTHPTQKGEAYINSCSCVLEISKVRARVVKNNLPDRKSAEAHLAIMQLHQLRDCYRKGWKPDWSDDKDKFLISQGNKGACVIKTRYHSSAFLSFQSEKIAELFLANFQDLIRSAGDLI